MFDTVLNQFQVTHLGFSTAILAVTTILTAGCQYTDRRDYLGLKVEKNTEPRIGEFISVDICPVIKPELVPVQQRSRSQLSASPTKSAYAPITAIAAQFTVNSIGEVLIKEEGSRDGQILAFGVIPRPVLNNADNHPELNLFSCMSLTRGLVGEPRNGIPESDGGMKKDDLNTLGLADYPAFHLELKTTWVPLCSDDKDPSYQMTLTPSYLHYAQSSALRKGSGRKSVTGVFAISTKQPKGKDEFETDATAVFRHNFGYLKIGNYFDEKQLKGTEAAQIITELSGPMISGLITESENQDIALKAFSKAYKSNEDELSKALKEVIVGTTGRN